MKKLKELLSYWDYNLSKWERSKFILSMVVVTYLVFQLFYVGYKIYVHPDWGRQEKELKEIKKEIENIKISYYELRKN